jgi:hypothetical protein
MFIWGPPHPAPSPDCHLPKSGRRIPRLQRLAACGRVGFGCAQGAGTERVALGSVLTHPHPRVLRFAPHRIVTVGCDTRIIWVSQPVTAYDDGKCSIGIHYDKMITVAALQDDRQRKIHGDRWGRVATPLCYLALPRALPDVSATSTRQDALGCNRHGCAGARGRGKPGHVMCGRAWMMHA